MPRTSPEERAASFYRAGKKPIEAPRVLSTRAKNIWRQIVTAKPVDWFDASMVGLLADHCETQCRLEEVWARLRRYPVGSREGRELLVDLRTLRGNYAVSSKLLRLTVQAAVERRSTMAGEAAPDNRDDELVGGAAVRPIRMVA
jgi:phage terminase small subunit